MQPWVRSVRDSIRTPWTTIAVGVLCLATACSSAGMATGGGGGLGGTMDATTGTGGGAAGGDGTGGAGGIAGRGGDGGRVDATDGGTTGDVADAATICVAASIAGASVSWKENGQPECADTVTIDRMTTATRDMLTVHASTLGGAGPGFTISAAATPPQKLEGEYTCQPGAGNEAPLSYGNFAASATKSCTVVVTSGGAPGGMHATGTFSATFQTDGGLTMVSAGVFDIPVPAAPAR